MATRAFNDLIDLLETRPETVSEYLLEQKRLKSSEPQVYKAMAKRGIIELDENGEPKEWKMGNIHAYWSELKKLMKKEYGVDWKSPADRNPHTRYDWSRMQILKLWKYLIVVKCIRSYFAQRKCLSKSDIIYLWTWGSLKGSCGRRQINYGVISVRRIINMSCWGWFFWNMFQTRSRRGIRRRLMAIMIPKIGIGIWLRMFFGFPKKLVGSIS